MGVQPSCSTSTLPPYGFSPCHQSSHAPRYSHLGLSLCESLSHGLGLSLPLFLYCLLQLHTPQQFCWQHHHPCGACGSPPAESAAHQKRRAVGNRTHRERRRTSSCIAERIAPVRRDPQRMLRDGRRPRGNSCQRRRPATTRRRVVFRANGDDRRLPRRQYEPRLKGHLRRGRRAERRAARQHDPRARRPLPRSLYPALHPLPRSLYPALHPIPLSPGHLPPNRASLPSSLPASPCLSIRFLPQTLPLQLQRVCVASRSEAGVCAAAEHCHVLVSQAEEEREEPKAKGSDDSTAGDDS
ncbi:unnamed protein product [Closterium sp. NIES-53]